MPEQVAARRAAHMAERLAAGAHVAVAWNTAQQQAYQAQEQLLEELNTAHLPAFWAKLLAIQQQIDCQAHTKLSDIQQACVDTLQQQQQPINALCTKLRDALQALWSVVHTHQQQLCQRYADLVMDSLQDVHIMQQKQQVHASKDAPRSNTSSIHNQLSFGALLRQQEQSQGADAQQSVGCAAGAAAAQVSCLDPLHNAPDDGRNQAGSFSFPSLQPAALHTLPSAASQPQTPPSAASFIPLFTPMQCPPLSPQQTVPPTPAMSFIPIHTPECVTDPPTPSAFPTGPAGRIQGCTVAQQQWQQQQVDEKDIGRKCAHVSLLLCGALKRYASSTTACIMDSATCSLTGLLRCLFDAHLAAAAQQQESIDENSVLNSMGKQRAFGGMTPGSDGTRDPMCTPMSAQTSCSPSTMMDFTMADTVQGSVAQDKQPAQAAVPSLSGAQLQLHQLVRKRLAERSQTAACSTPGVCASESEGGMDTRSSSTPTAASSPVRMDTCVDGDSMLAQVAGLLYQLGLWPAVQEAAAHSVAAAVRHHCQQAAQGLDMAALPGAWCFMEQVPLQFLATLLQHARHEAQQQQQIHVQDRHSLQAWRQRLIYLVYESVCDVRLDQVWDMLVDYPDSTPAVEDLAACLAHTNTQQRFIHCVRSVVSRRLLHAGASAEDVVHTYMTLIRVLQMLDPAGGLLHAVADPVRLYLRCRPDTVRCVVERVTGASAKPCVASTADMDNAEDDEPQQQSLLEELQQEECEQQEQGGGAAGLPRLSNNGKLSWGAAALVNRPAVWYEDDVLALLDQQQQQQASTVQQAQAAEGRQAGKTRQPLTSAPGLIGGSRRWTNDIAAQPAQAQGHAAAKAAQVDNTLLGEVPGSALFGPPTPPRAKSGLRGSRQGSSSIASVVQLLVAVFPSKEHFMMEYRAMLAGGLLRSLDYDTTAALRTNELLKLRLGEARLHAAEVMLKDVADSKRVAAACHQHQQAAARAHHPPPAWLSALITSHLFWPPMGGWGEDDRKGDSALAGAPGCLSTSAGVEPAAAGLNLPDKVQQGLNAFAASFHALKAPRKLHWRPHVGCVELQVSVGGVSIDFHVSPVLASLLMAFEEHAQLSVEQVADMVALPVLLVQRRLLFWVEHGILTEATTQTASDAAAGSVGPDSMQPHVLHYQRATWLDPARDGLCVTDADTFDEALLSAGGLAAGDKTLLQEMGPYEPYLMGVLLSTGGLPLERLHTMLKRFVVSPKYDKSVDQLSAFLAVLVSAGKLVVQGGVYKRKPAAVKPSEN